jgi:hypothetical protein
MSERKISYIPREEYTVLLNALELACNFIRENGFTVTKENEYILPYLAHNEEIKGDTLTGYFIMEVRNELEKDKENNNSVNT